MRILVTGAKGFVGKNLCAQLNNIKDGKARCYGDVAVEAVYEYDLDSTPEQLDIWCKEADFVFNLAGVNRPQNQEEFMQGNFGFASTRRTRFQYGQTGARYPQKAPQHLPGDALQQPAGKSYWSFW